MHKYWKIIIPSLFALAMLLGLAQRSNNPYLNFQSRIFHFENSSPSDKSLTDYYNLSKQLAGQNQASSTVNFLAVGDIMLSRNVAASIKKTENPLLPFSQMANVLNGADFAFGNLESPFSGSDYFNASGSMVFNAPKNNITGLTEYKFKILNLANNHALDQGIKGSDYTIKYLSDNQIQHIGAGDNLDQAWQPAIIEQNGIKIGFVGASYSSINDSGKTKNDYVARIENLEKLKATIYKLKAECDFIVATMHAGVEYTRTPNQAQKNFAHAAIDAGADMVIGSHPHWIQTMEKYNDKYIFYSLGNFIFDQMWSTDTKEGLVLKIQVSKNQGPNPIISGAAKSDDLQGQRVPAKLDKIELIPIVIENYSTPRPGNEQETKKILEKIGQNSSVLMP